ncbi:unnamed protein product [Cylicostephanus goldi]|uniref:Uncharacterized protein n=1 Tax=Cylicostephanus goldi TaxID=71465 RepID=A0A3P6UY44_CYLGO|nr:unnamed protein product [Cylicostephanus goldi]
MISMTSPFRSSSAPAKRGCFGASFPVPDPTERLRAITADEAIPSYLKLMVDILLETKREIADFNQKMSAIIKENVELKEENRKMKMESSSS